MAQTEPVGAGVGRPGKLPINASLQMYYNAKRSRFASDWQPRLQIKFLLPGFK